MEQRPLTESLRETLTVFEGSAEPRTTPEVAEHLDLGRRTTYARLERLVEADRLETKKVGANARVWWRTVSGAGAPEGEQWKQQFRSLVDATEEYAIFMLDDEGYVQTWNPGAERIKGYGEDEIVGEHFSAFYTDEDREQDVPERNLERAAEEGSVQDEGWRVRADGSTFWANVTITAIRDDDGDLVGFAKVTRDMTDRREYERELEEEQAFVESLLDTQLDVMYAFDTDATLLRWNDRFREVTGYTDEELASMEASDFIAERAHEETAEVIQTVVEDRERVTVELPLVTEDGEEIPYEFRGGPIVDESDDVIGFTGIGRDVSERKAREQRLERQRDDLRHELDDVFTRIDEAFFALDEEWRVTYVNDRAAELVGRPVGELLQSRVWDALPEVAEGEPRELTERALTTQDSVEFEFYSEILGRWVEVREYPSETGLSVYVRDITDRKERERTLEQYRTVTETASDAVVTIGEDDCIRSVNPAVEDVFGYEPEELVGEPLTTLMPDRLADAHREGITRYTETGERRLDWDHVELPGVTADGDEVPLSISFSEYEHAGERYFTGIIRDVTERKERERELRRREQRFETVAEHFPNGAVALVDRDLHYTTFGGTPEGHTDKTREDFEGGYLPDVLSEELADVVVPGYEAALDGEPSEFADSVGDSVYQFHFVPVRDENGDVFAAMGMSQDVTERVENERELENQVRQQEAVAEIGRKALGGVEPGDLFAEAAELVTETLDTDYCKVMDLDEASEELLLRQGVGWQDDIVGEATVSAVEADSQAAYTLETEEPVIVEDLDTEPRFSGPDLLRNHDVESGISTIIGPTDDPWGILGAHDTDRREFADHDATFVQAIANVLAAAIEQHDYEQELVHQREQLAALNSLNEVVRDITGAVIEQSTREEIEETVCERLAATDSYQFAWIGDVDTNTQTVNLRTEAGVEDYLDDVTISVDPADERSEGPTGRALRTGEVDVTNDVRTEGRHGPWESTVEEYDFRSSAAIPVVHEGTTYGVLNVYAARPDAFTGTELDVITQLGEIVGHSIAATERKRALMSDELVELDFQIEDVLAAFGASESSNGTITLDGTVAVGGGEFLVYGTATPDAVDTLHALVDAIPYWDDVTVETGDEDPATFELRTTDPPVLSVVASLGGYIDNAVIEDADLRLTIHLAPTADVRRVIDAVEDAYPGAEMLRRRQMSRERGGSERAQRALSELTDRQRTALEVAHHAGFFEWPREATGEEVAESIGVAPPTFHQHLRKAERKIFDAVFSSPV